jgi:hypothetical protein
MNSQIRIQGNPLPVLALHPDIVNQSETRNLLKYLVDLYEGGESPWKQVKLMIVGKEGP